MVINKIRFLIFATFFMVASTSLMAEPDQAFRAKLDGFRIIAIDNLNLQPTPNPTSALWQLFRGEPDPQQESISLRTTMFSGVAVVDLKIEGVLDRGVKAVFYRAIVEKGRFGWMVTYLGRKHRCARFGLGVIPVWTASACL